MFLKTILSLNCLFPKKCNTISKELVRLKASSGSEKNSDVIFLVGEEPDIQRIPAHSWILIKGSPVFRAMFKGPLSPVNSVSNSNNKDTSRFDISEESRFKISKVEDVPQLTPVIEHENESDSASHSSESKSCSAKASDSSTHPKSSITSSINMTSNESMATKEESVEDLTPSNNKELSKEKDDYSNSDTNTDNSSVNSEPVKKGDKDLNFSKGGNGSVFGTSDNPSASRGENNGVCIKTEKSGNSVIHDGESKKHYSIAKNIGTFIGCKKASIAVSDVDGRAFDILLKYLYNENIDLPSVMTALTTLYAAHKYMCPGLAKEVVSYLKNNLKENNVLLVLQHICLYCSSATDDSSNIEPSSKKDSNYWDVPVTTSPVSFFATSLLGHGGMGLATQISSNDTSPPSQKTHSSDHGIVPSAPPADSSEVEEQEIDIKTRLKNQLLSISDVPLESSTRSNEDCNTQLIDENLVLDPDATEDELRDFENSMNVSDSNGGWGPGGKRKINCCKVLMKKCLELIDSEASSVLACEDIEDLDVTTLRMIVCRETLCIQSESEVFNALRRWSDRECRRQHLELTPSNRRRVLEGCQYLVRYLTLTREEFVNVPYKSGLLCKDEEEALLAQISCRGTAKATAAAVDLPEHLWQWQTIMRTKRRGKAPVHGIQISSGRKFTYPSLGGSNKSKKHSSKKGKSAKTSYLDKNKEMSISASGNRAFSITPSLSNNNATNGANAKEKFNIVEEFFVCLACIFD